MHNGVHVLEWIVEFYVGCLNQLKIKYCKYEVFLILCYYLFPACFLHSDEDPLHARTQPLSHRTYHRQHHPLSVQVWNRALNSSSSCLCFILQHTLYGWMSLPYINCNHWGVQFGRLLNDHILNFLTLRINIMLGAQL